VSGTRSGDIAVGVVLVNWNGWQHTVEACKSLGDFGGPGVKTIIVDNASTDSSVERIRAALSAVEVVANPINMGFAGGCNVGIGRALEMGCNYIFLLNNDALVTPNTISELIVASERLNDTAILGSVVRYVGSRGYQFFGSRSTPVFGQPAWFTCPNDEKLLEAGLIETDFVLGAALFIPAKLIETIGLFDERFYLTYEDVDLCYRARNIGALCGIVTSSTVYHHASVSMGPEDAPLQTYFLTRNELLFTEKHGKRRQRFHMYYLRLGRLIWRTTKALATGSWSDPSLKAMVLGYRDYVLRRFGDCPGAVRRYAGAYHRRSQQKG
jgi:GT2 family glycosyltransferase